MARKVNVHRGNSSLGFMVKRQQAKEMVRQGLAYMADKWNAILVPQAHHKTQGIRPSNQGAVYELAAIENYRQFTQGGMTRDEHQPVKFQFFRAAKVGHQL